MTKKSLLTAALIVFVAILGGIYFYSSQSTQILAPAVQENDGKTNSSNTTADKSLKETGVGDLKGWSTYQNTKHNFEISYPPGFTIVPHHTPTFFDNTLGFNQSILYVEATPTAFDARWGITIFDGFESSNEATEKIISKIGAQWNRDNSRSEQRASITVNNLPAILVTVRTSNHDDWISKTVIVQHNKRIYAIGNGAVEDQEFDQFYSSFRILN